MQAAAEHIPPVEQAAACANPLRARGTVPCRAHNPEKLVQLRRPQLITQGTCPACAPIFDPVFTERMRCAALVLGIEREVISRVQRSLGEGVHTAVAAILNEAAKAILEPVE